MGKGTGSPDKRPINGERARSPQPHTPPCVPTFPPPTVAPHQPSRVPGAVPGCGTVGPAALGWWPLLIPPHRRPPSPSLRCRQVPTCLFFPGFMSSLRPWLRAAPLPPACLSPSPSKTHSPRPAARGRPTPGTAGPAARLRGWESPGASGRYEQGRPEPQPRGPTGASSPAAARHGSARFQAAPRRGDAAFIRSRSRGTNPTPPPHHPKTIPSPPRRGPYLGLGEPQLGRQLGTLRQRQVLGLLEALVEGLQLQAGVDGARLAQLLPLAVDAQLPVGHGRGLLVILGRGAES